VIAIVVFFIAFLRIKARVSWLLTLTLTAAAVGVLSLMTNALLVELPTGLLPVLVDLPWR